MYKLNFNPSSQSEDTTKRCLFMLWQHRHFTIFVRTLCSFVQERVRLRGRGQSYDMDWGVARAPRHVEIVPLPTWHTYTVTNIHIHAHIINTSRIYLYLGAVHILRQPKKGVHRPPPPPLVSNGQHFTDPPSPPRQLSSAFARLPLLYYNFWPRLFDMIKWGYSFVRI